jgi:adenosylcobinamide-phosphate synthase
VPRRRDLAVGLVLGTALDAVVPDPRRGHPVAVFGTAASRLEQRIWADSRPRGAVFTAICVGAAIQAGRLMERRAGRFRPAAIAAGTWAVLGARSLRVEGRAVHDRLAADDLAAAREQVTHLVGRDPSVLDTDGVARAALESIAENTCDAIVAPMMWGAVAGLPGLLGYRAVNTLDAMVGHRSPRYARFGWASARLDDLANLAPARATALLIALAAPAVGGDTRTTLRIAVRDGGKHPSPNSGERPPLGDGARPRTADLRRATRLCAAVTVVAGPVVAAIAGVVVPATVARFRAVVPEWCRCSEDR